MLPRVLESEKPAQAPQGLPGQDEQGLHELQRRIDKDLGRPMVRLAADMGVHKSSIINIMRDVVKPWMEDVISRRPYVFQQDRALPTRPR